MQNGWMACERVLANCCYISRVVITYAFSLALVPIHGLRAISKIRREEEKYDSEEEFNSTCSSSSLSRPVTINRGNCCPTGGGGGGGG